MVRDPSGALRARLSPCHPGHSHTSSGQAGPGSCQGFGISPCAQPHPSVPGAGRSWMCPPAPLLVSAPAPSIPGTDSGCTCGCLYWGTVYILGSIMSISGYQCDLSGHIHFSHIYPLLASQEWESFGLFCAAQTLKRKNKKKHGQNEVVACGIFSSPGPLPMVSVGRGGSGGCCGSRLGRSRISVGPAFQGTGSSHRAGAAEGDQPCRAPASPHPLQVQARSPAAPGQGKQRQPDPFPRAAREGAAVYPAWSRSRGPRAGAGAHCRTHGAAAGGRAAGGGRCRAPGRAPGRARAPGAGALRAGDARAGAAPAAAAGSGQDELRLGDPLQHQLHGPAAALPQARPGPPRLPGPPGQGAALLGPGVRVHLPARRAAVDGGVRPGAAAR